VIRVLVMASSPVVRAGLEAMLRADARFSLAEATNAMSATRLRAGNADVVLMEIVNIAKLQSVLPGAAAADAPPTVLLADDLGRAELRRALHTGVRAVLPRNASAVEIAAAIEAVAAGLAVLSESDLDALLPAGPEVSSAVAPEEPLSSREIEVLAMMAEGMANKEIAVRLNISEHTVKFHVSSILAKLSASSRGEAVARGVREGLIVI
jgi:two-component system, NarL family, response regulator YdfI